MCTIYLLVASLAILSVTASPALYIQKCNAGDSKCAKESTAAAIPTFAAGIAEYGITSLDPVMFKKLDASSPSLKLVLHDTTLKGLKSCKPKKVQHDLEKKKLMVKLLCEVQVDGDYDMKGHLLILPIEGKGKVHVHLKKIQISADLDMGETVGADGKKYWDIKKWQHSYELKDKATVNFENLFPGSEVLGRAARDLITSSGNEIINEVGPPIIKAFAAKIISNTNDFFHKVPLEDLVN